MLVAVIALLLQQGAAIAVDSAVEQGIAEGVFPGAVVVVGTAHRTLLARGYGHYAWAGASAVPDPDSSLFDLASLTKVVATTPAVMLLVQTGRLDLDRPVQEYLPGFVGAGKAQVTVRHLLEHRSGLRAFLPLNERASTPEEARQLVLTEPLRHPPGTVVEYSDLNGMLLGWVIEQVAQEPLDSFVEDQLYPRLGMGLTLYRPPSSMRPRMLPVGLWRGHAIAGEVHDQNAMRLGGVSGHAGLYSTGSDLAKYAQELLLAGSGAQGARVFREGVVAHFTRRRAGNRALGWEMRDTTTGDNAGLLLSDAAFGHTGYTGTSIWIDPSLDLFVIVLTNRVFAPRTGSSITKLKRVRGRIADAAERLRREVCSARTAGSDPCE